MRDTELPFYVLIDTQWNVKDSISGMASGNLIVLIDTQWNVKKNVLKVSSNAELF